METNTMPRFVNAQAMKKKHKAFKAPPLAALATVDRGDYVKICTGNERFWVKITSRKAGYLYGTVQNKLLNTPKHGLTLRSKVRFKPHHIYAIRVV